jgi:hypothetical protein
VKTTVQIPDALLRGAKAYAVRQGIPLREVIALGLQMVLRGHAEQTGQFRLKTVITKGKGLGIRGDWSEIRSLTYEEHGG